MTQCRHEQRRGVTERTSSVDGRFHLIFPEALSVKLALRQAKRKTRRRLRNLSGVYQDAPCRVVSSMDYGIRLRQGETRTQGSGKRCSANWGVALSLTRCVLTMWTMNSSVFVETQARLGYDGRVIELVGGLRGAGGRVYT